MVRIILRWVGRVCGTVFFPEFYISSFLFNFFSYAELLQFVGHLYTTNHNG